MTEAISEQRIVPAGFLVLRTPLLPFDEFLSWSEGLEAVSLLDDPERFEVAYKRDCELLRKRLNHIVTRREVRDAIFLASPNFIERLHLWTNDQQSERGRKIEQVLVRYFSRMTGRATPFGLFAGVSTGIVGDKTSLLLAGRKDYQRYTRVSTSYLTSLTDAITRNATLRENLNFLPNSSLYRAGDRLHYVEVRHGESERSYHLIAVEETEYLALAIDHARAGVPPVVVANALLIDDVTREDALDFVGELIESQILVPDVELNVSGPEPLEPLIQQLSKAKEVAPITDVLQETQKKLRLIDGEGVGVDLDRYQMISSLLQSLPAKLEQSNLFHVDLVKPVEEAMLGPTVLKEIERGVRLLHRLSDGDRENDLSRFREAFFQRYEDREVPLAEALDEEIGIGFGKNAECSPLLENVDLFSSDAEQQIEKNHATKLRKLCEALTSGAREIDLTVSDIEELSQPNRYPLPDPLAIIVTLIAPTPLAVAQGDFRVLIGQGSGPSAALTMGRFCHADQKLFERVKMLIRNEEAKRPDAVFAEIVHLPKGKLGNIASRPQMRDYEIPFLGRSLVDCDHQIPLTDLRVSLTDNRIKLRSVRLNREVIPRMSNAHNYSLRSPSVYRFLCMLQNQDTAWLQGWDWGALVTAPFLPRVCSGRLVLSPARWHVTKDDLAEFTKEKRAARFRTVQFWRKRWGLPRFVTLTQHDNLLVVDLDNELSVESFVQLAREKESITLLELYPTPDELFASGPEGSFFHELIVPFSSETPWSAIQASRERRSVTVGTHSVTSDVTKRRSQLVGIARQRFLPGSEWLYLKVYTGPATADRLLCDLVAPLIKALKNEGYVDRWFFIRLSDPDFHLRLRFHGEPNDLRHKLQPKLKDALARFVDDKRIWRVQFDTYEPEVERYGGYDGLALSEELFQIDSEAVLQLLEVLSRDDSGLDKRWRLAVFGIDCLLNDFGFGLGLKHAIIKEVRDEFAQEFKMDQKLHFQLNDKFRAERNVLQRLLTATSDPEDLLGLGLPVFESRSRQVASVVRELLLSERNGRLSCSIHQLVTSYIHMFINRLLRSAHRPQELVIYHLLSKFYESLIKRV